MVMVMACLTMCGASCRRKPPTAPSPTGARDAALPKHPTDLAGVVEDSQGAPLPDALVIAWPKGRHGTNVVQARSDQDGRFVLPQLRAGTWTLLAEAAGFGTLECDQVAPQPGRVVLTLDGRSRRIEGVVLQDGHPLPEARVALGGPGLRWPRETASDSNGFFSFSGLGLGRVVLRATHERKVSSAVPVTIDEDQDTSPARLRLVVSAGAEIEGRVLDDRGEPVVGATVDALTVPSDDLPASAQADTQGRYRIGPVPSGRYQILPRADGYVPLDPREHQLAASTKTTHDLRLARAARLIGCVRDEKGLPLSGVAVTAVSLVGGRDELTVVAGPLPTAAEAAELPPGTVSRQGSSRAATSNLMGEYIITGVAPGPARLDFVHPDKLPYRREPLLLAPGESREIDESVLVAGVSLTGQVLDEGGQPIDGAQVEARPTPKPTRQLVSVSTDLHGQFALRVPAGDYAITIRAEGYQSQSVPLVRAMSGVALDPIQARLRPSARPKKQ
jgi:uncharacterized GH25 family protein